MYWIWSFEHNGWWAPAKAGYVPDVARAGIYNSKEAHQIVENAMLGGHINEALVPVTTEIEFRTPTGINPNFLD